MLRFSLDKKIKFFVRNGKGCYKGEKTLQQPFFWAEKSLCHVAQGGFFLGFSDFKKGERIIVTLCISYVISIAHQLRKSLYIV